MHKPVVTGGPVVSRIILVGQAPGDKEPVLGRPFAWTAGKTLFKWFEDATGINEQEFRSHIYMAAACRCFPGKKPQGGDRVPSRIEVTNCAYWRDREFEILQPDLVIPVGKLGISQFLAVERLDEVIGKQFRVKVDSSRGHDTGGVAPRNSAALTARRAVRAHEFDVIPLPHPSGASPWHRMEPGKALLGRAMKLIACHPAMRELTAAIQRERIARRKQQAAPA
jgi:uracil-DNA glycosylase